MDPRLRIQRAPLPRFQELVLKEILRQHHELLALDASRKHVILYKLLMGEVVAEPDMEGLQTPEFKTTLDRLCQLVSTGCMREPELQGLPDKRDLLSKLNHLRNRAWHRGTFVLRYCSLDQLFGEHLLPLLDEIIALPICQGKERLWKYKNLSCGVDPLGEIRDELSKPDWDLRKVAFLKELGRAAYANPLISPPAGEAERSRAIVDRMNLPRRRESRAAAKAAGEGACERRECPVCGNSTFVLFEDVEEDIDPKSGDLKNVSFYIYRARCLCCTFEANHELENPSEYGLPITDIWRVM